MCVIAKSCLALCDPLDYSPRAPLSMRFSRKEYWSELPFPPPGYLPDPGIEPIHLAVEAQNLNWKITREAPRMSHFKSKTDKLFSTHPPDLFIKRKKKIPLKKCEE